MVRNSEGELSYLIEQNAEHRRVEDGELEIKGVIEKDLRRL